MWKSTINFYRSSVFPLEKSYHKDKDWDVFRDIEYRAQTIISNFDEETINRESEIARNYLFSVDMLSKSTESKLFKKIPEALARGILNLSYAYRIKHSYHIFGPKNYKITHWNLFFALIALYEIDTCMLIQQSINSGRYSFSNYNKREQFQAYARSAQEAVIYAENAIEIEKEIKLSKSKNAKKAAFSKHAPRRELYREFIEFYLKGDFKSRSKAADQFIEVKGIKNILLTPTNAKETLLRNLRKYEQGLEKFK